MPEQLPGEDLEMVLAEFDRRALGDVYDTAVKLEERGVPGLALKVFEYVIDRYGPEPTDAPFDRMMGSIIYTHIGKLNLMKGDYERSSSALVKAIRLDPRNTESRFYAGELLLARGNHDAALACYIRILNSGSTTDLMNQSMERVNQIFLYAGPGCLN